MTSVAFATYQQSPEISDDDRLVAQQLRSHGVSVHAVPWDASHVDWQSFDQVIIRSAWDYHLKLAAYQEWLNCFQSNGVPFWNPPATVLANLNKRYLEELAAEGNKVIPAVYIASGDERSLGDIIQSCEWAEVVIKPAVSASARGTWRSSLERAEADDERFSRSILAEDHLVQPYLPEVAAVGEWSLVFFDREFSHAVLKRPATGDFRVQRHLGGTTIAAEPGGRIRQQAQEILSSVDGRLLYARVDGIERDGDFLLMELEINEPFLFLSYSEGAATRFAQAILR